MNDRDALFREKKLKKTPLRLAILEVFSGKTEPITIAELQEELKKLDFFPNITSLYRQIETLGKAEILETVMLKSDVAHYEIQQEHHHHFLCTKCERITCVHNGSLEKEIHAFEEKLNQSGIQIAAHHFSFSGRCQKCQ